MSTILDALRKAEQERDLGKVPDLRSFHTPATTPPQRNWWGAGLALLVLNGLLLAWLMGASVQSLWKPSVPNIAIQTPTITSPAPLLAATSADPSPVTEQATATSTPAPQISTREHPLATVPQPPMAALVEQPFPNQPREAELQNLAPEVLMNLAETPLPIPLEAMPESFQRSLPSLNLDIHVYSDEAARRFVLINGKRYREGDWLQEGPLLESISPEGVIMNYQQARFTLPIER